MYIITEISTVSSTSYQTEMNNSNNFINPKVHFEIDSKVGK